MSKLQQRRRQRRRRQERSSRLRIAGWLAMALAATLVYCLLQLPATHAFFTDREELPPLTFRAATFADNLMISPGTSTTNNSPGDPGPDFPVAQIIDGQLSLDFGTSPAGNNRNFESVLIVQNISAKDLTVEWQFSGSLAALLAAPAGSVTIQPGGSFDLAVKLNTGSETPPGEYNGSLLISALNGFLSAEIPARLQVAEKDRKDKGKDAKAQAAVTDAAISPAAISPEAITPETSSPEAITPAVTSPETVSPATIYPNAPHHPEQPADAVKTPDSGSVYPNGQQPAEGGNSDGNSSTGGS